MTFGKTPVCSGDLVLRAALGGRSLTVFILVGREACTGQLARCLERLGLGGNDTIDFIADVAAARQVHLLAIVGHRADCLSQLLRIPKNPYEN